MNSTQLIKLERAKTIIELERMNKRNHFKIFHDMLVDLIKAYDEMLITKNK